MDFPPVFTLLPGMSRYLAKYQLAAVPGSLFAIYLNHHHRSQAEQVIYSVLRLRRNHLRTVVSHAFMRYSCNLRTPFTWQRTTPQPALPTHEKANHKEAETDNSPADKTDYRDCVPRLF